MCCTRSAGLAATACNCHDRYYTSPWPNKNKTPGFDPQMPAWPFWPSSIYSAISIATSSAAVLESLKQSDLGLTDTNLGSLMSGFLVVYTLLAPVFGALGDRRSRPRLIAFGVACWSFATVLSGFAVNFLTLFAARAAVGVGEAAYVTIAPSLLSDYFPVRQRGRVMAIFFCAIPVGSALGYVVGGLVDKHYGWRAAFFVAGIPGLMLAALCLLLRDPPRGIQDHAAGLAKEAPKPARTSISRESLDNLLDDCCATSPMRSRCSAMQPTRSPSAAWLIGCRHFSNEHAASRAARPPSISAPSWSSRDSSAHSSAAGWATTSPRIRDRLICGCRRSPP